MSEKIKDPGLGLSNTHTSRMINKDGSYNVQRKGTIGGVKDFYQFLLSLSWPRFILLVFTYLIIFNLLFAFLYLIAGVEHIGGLEKTSSYRDLLYSFYFSVQTMSGVGYGSFFPKGHSVLMISSFEALLGLLSIALVTGVLFGRFSKPNAKIRYSKNILIAPYKDKKAFMFRIANARNSAMMEMSSNLMATMVRKDLSGNFRGSIFHWILKLIRLISFPLPGPLFIH